MTDDDEGALGGQRSPYDEEAADHPAVVQTPEQVARDFLQSGARMVPVKPQPDAIAHVRRRRMVAGIAAAVIVLAVLAAVTLLHNKQPSSSTRTTRTDPANPVTSTVPSTTRASTTTTTAPTALPAAGAITVTVLNASTVNGLAAQTSLALGQDGFLVGPVGTAPNKIPAGSPSQILYGTGGLPAAQVLAASLSGPVTMVQSPFVSGLNLTLQIASAQLTVIPAGATTTTTAPPANP